MKKNLILILLVIVGIFGLSRLVAEPTGQPHSVLTALQGIQDALITLAEQPPVMGVKTAGEIDPNATTIEGYCGDLELVADSNQVVFTVPLGRQFVLRKLYVYHKTSQVTHLWQLTADDAVLVPGSIAAFGQGVHDFPDNCVIVNAGETLKAVNDWSYVFHATIIGYLRNAE
jgi:hypothetical protein